MTPMRLASALLAVSLVLAAGGCAVLTDQVPAETRSAADDLQKAFAGIDGVADAAVRAQHETDDYDPVISTLTLVDDASQARLAAVIEVVPGLVADSGLADVQAVAVVLHDGASVSVGVGPAADPSDPAATARLLFRLADVVGERGTVQVATPLAASVGLDDATADDLSGLLHDALDDPVLSAEGVSWWATAYSEMGDETLRTWSGDLSAGPGGLATTLRGYDGILASYGAAPPGVTLVRVKASGGRHGVVLSNVMDFQPAVSDADLTPAVWGDRMGPLLTAQAAVVDDLPKGSMLDVTIDGGEDGGPFLIYPGASYSQVSNAWVEFLAGP